MHVVILLLRLTTPTFPILYLSNYSLSWTLKRVGIEGGTGNWNLEMRNPKHAFALSVMHQERIAIIYACSTVVSHSQPLATSAGPTVLPH